MNEVLLKVGEYLIATIFSAGVSYGLLKAFMGQTRKDLNGLGAKVREQDRSHSDQFFAIAVSLILAAKNDRERRIVANRLLNSNRKR